MQIVIDIPDRIYSMVQNKTLNIIDSEIVEKAIKNGTPQPRTGRWIFDKILDKHYYCSECKSMGVDYWDYCPNCGARMESEGTE